MHGATHRLACIVGVMLLFESFPALMAAEKEKTLFRVYESIFRFGRIENRVLEVDPNGRVLLTVTYGDIFSRDSETKKSEAVLNAAELQALRDFMAGAAIQDLLGAYLDDSRTTDYAASMKIEINLLKEPNELCFPTWTSRERTIPRSIPPLCTIWSVRFMASKNGLAFPTTTWSVST